MGGTRKKTKIQILEYIYLNRAVNIRILQNNEFYKKKMHLSNEENYLYKIIL